MSYNSTDFRKLDPAYWCHCHSQTNHRETELINRGEKLHCRHWSLLLLVFLCTPCHIAIVTPFMHE
jgi:hypothetical protein